MQPAPQPPKSSSTLLKVFLIGCISLIVIGVIATTVLFYAGKRWVTEKAKKFENVGGTEGSEYQKRAEKVKEEHPFSVPADGIITEDQLVRFLEVRKAVYQIYKNHETEIKSTDQKNQGLGGAMKVMEIINELKLAKVKALESQRMSEDEYNYITTAVYTSWFAKAAKEGLKDNKSYSEAANSQLQQQIDQIDKQLQDPNVPEETKKQLQSVRDTLVQQQKNISSDQSIQQMDKTLQDVPQANIDLFTKHQAEIQQYSMAGLEYFGF